MTFGTMGYLRKCKVCGKLILVEEIINGSSHTMDIIVNCWECCPDDVKQRAREMYGLKEAK